MKKLLILPMALMACLFLTTSCHKEDDDVNATIDVALEPNQAYTYKITNLGDDDEEVQITKAAGHALSCTVSPVANSSATTFEYTPAKDYTGIDEVVVSAVEHGRKGKCNHHDDDDKYTFRITIKQPAE